MNFINNFICLVLFCQFAFVFGIPKNFFAEIKSDCPNPDSDLHLDEFAKSQDKACEARLVASSFPSVYEGIDVFTQGHEVTRSILKTFILKYIGKDCRIKKCAITYAENRYACLGNSAPDRRMSHLLLYMILGTFDAVCDQEIQESLTSAIDETPDACINKIFNQNLRTEYLKKINTTSCVASTGTAFVSLLGGQSFQAIRNQYEATLIANCISTTIHQICGDENEKGFTNFVTKFLSRAFDSKTHDRKWEAFNKAE